MDEISRNQHAEALEGGFNCFYSKEGSVRWDKADIIERTLKGDFALHSQL